MKINLRVRMRNPWFWIGILAVVLSALDVEPSTITSWHAVWVCAVETIQNPYRLVLALLAILSVFVDPTTAGLRDSQQALSYTHPKRDDTTK
jgi:phi LC3 family holin